LFGSITVPPLVNGAMHEWERACSRLTILPYDKERRKESNRNFFRIVSALPTEVARRYGHVEASVDHLEERLKNAIAAKDWAAVNQLSADLAQRRPSLVA
jgi:hypothetical protein